MASKDVLFSVSSDQITALSETDESTKTGLKILLYVRIDNTFTSQSLGRPSERPCCNSDLDITPSEHCTSIRSLGLVLLLGHESALGP